MRSLTSTKFYENLRILLLLGVKGEAEGEEEREEEEGPGDEGEEEGEEEA